MMGLVLAIWNDFWFGFPTLESGMQLLLGSVTMGIFSSTYLVIDVERDVIFAAQSNVERIEQSTFFSITRRFLMFVCTSLAVFAILLLIYKDFTTMIESYETIMAF